MKTEGYTAKEFEAVYVTKWIVYNSNYGEISKRVYDSQKQAQNAVSYSEQMEDIKPGYSSSAGYAIAEIKLKSDVHILEFMH